MKANLEDAAPRLRVCLASIHPRMLSGQIETLIALASRLEALGHDVRVVSAFPEASLRAERRWARDHGDGLALAPKVLRIGQIVSQIISAARNCDVLHFNVPTPAFAALADFAQLVARRPTVVGFEAHLVHVPSIARRLADAPEFYGPRLVNNGLVARTTLRRGRAYVVSSKLQLRELMALGYDPSRIHVIPNLIDDSKLARWPKDDARRALGLPLSPRAKLIAFVGHYHDVKGHDVLIKALPAIRATMDDARLVLAWSGIGSHSRVQALIDQLGIRAHVIELGRVDVGQLFSAADVVALPYRLSIGQAAFPGTVMEAMWVGVPLVTTDLPLLRELSAQGECAALARPDDPADLARQITGLLSDPRRAERIVEGQRRAMEGRLAADGLVSGYIQAYRHAVGRGVIERGERRLFDARAHESA